MSRATATAPQRLTGGAEVERVARGYPLTVTRSQTPQGAPQATQGGRSSAGVAQGMAHRQSHAEGAQSRHSARKSHGVRSNTY